MTRKMHPASLLGISTLALTLAACKIDNRPLLARGEPSVYAGAPSPGPLDPGFAPVAYLPPEQAYAYPERAYAMSRSFYQRPPSYAFAYEDEQPWVWEAADEGMMFAEPLDDGWRHYYYEPGEHYPYFVQDPDYGYAYGDGGTLIALFTAAGALLAADLYDDHYPRAHDYWTRAYDLNQTYWRSPRYPVRETVWRERAPALIAGHERWFRGVSAQPAWREAVARHDNGRHLGWYKNRGDKPGPKGPAAPVARPERREPDGWREARREPRAAAPAPREDRGRQEAVRKEWREARNNQPAARAAADHGQPAASRGGGSKPDRGGPPDRGGGGKARGGDHGGGKGGGHGGGGKGGK